MSEFTDNDFMEFLESFKGEIYTDNHFRKHNLFDEITEISRKDGGNREPLIKREFKMFSLDDMCHACKLLKSNTPKTTDALFYRENDDGSLSIYFIEFKFHNLDNPDWKDALDTIVDEINASTNKNKFKCLSEDYKYQLSKIKQYYGDEVEHKLIMKPIESIGVVVPALYEEYCQKEDENLKDIKTYLGNVEKKVFVFVSDYSPSGKENSSKNRNLTAGDKLNMYYERLKQGNLIDYYKIYHRDEWDNFIKDEQLVEIE